LMAKVPVRTRLDTSSASTWSSVNTDPASPKRESFAIPTASSMSSYWSLNLRDYDSDLVGLIDLADQSNYP
jgi:hypothetical protein